MAPHSPLRNHPRRAEIVLQIQQWITECRSIDYIWQGLTGPPWELRGAGGLPIGRGTAGHYKQLVERMMAIAEAKTDKGRRIAQHIATLRNTVALGYDEHRDGRAKYSELAKAVHDLTLLQARIDGSLTPSQLELTAAENSMYRCPPADLQAVLDLKAATEAQEQLSEET